MLWPSIVAAAAVNKSGQRGRYSLWKMFEVKLIFGASNVISTT